MKITVSIPDDRLHALDRVAAKEFGGNRSGAMVAALGPFLRERGELPGSEEERALEKVRAAFRAGRGALVGPKLDELLADASAARAALLEEVAS